MKIIFYYYMGGGGGLSNMIVLLRTIARRHPEDTIEIVTSPLTSFDAIGNLPNIKIRRFRLTGMKETDRFLLNFFYLPRILHETAADILWAMNLGPYNKPDVPFVLSVQNPYQVYPWSVSRYHPGSILRVAVLRWSFRRSLRCSDAAIAQTPLMEDYIRRVRGAPRDIWVATKAVEQAIDVQPEPLPPFLQSALESGLGSGVFTFLYVSTFMPHKNHIALVRAFAELARRKVRARVIFTVKPEEISKIGGRHAADLVEKGYIIPVGWVDKPYLKSLYEASDACLMPSMLESLSSAHIEAMQLGKPQITADLDYARDICGSAALYADAADIRAWIKQIENLMSDESLRLKLTDAGKERMNKFPTSWEEASERVYQCLASVRRR